MKRLYIAVAMLLIAISLCVGEVMIIKEAFDSLNLELRKTEQVYLEDKKTAKRYAASAYTSWQKYNMWLSLFLNNEAIDEISFEIVALNNSIEKSDYDFENSISNLRLLLDNIEENEKFNLLGMF